MKNIDLTKGPVLKSLLAFTLPVFFIYFCNNLYNALNIFVLNMAGASEQIGAIGSAFTPINLCLCLLIGCGIAGTFLIGQYVGGKDEERKLRACKTVIIFNMSFATLLGVVVAAFSPLIISALHIADQFKDAALRYMLILCLILPLNGIVYSTHAVCKGHGKSVLPFIYSLLGVGFNTLYDFIFMYFLNMKSDGAAIASVLAYISAAICILSYLAIFKFKFKNPLKGVKAEWKMFKHLIKQAIPLAFQEALFVICFIVLVSVINSNYSPLESDAIIISDRITAMTYVPIMAFGNATSAAIAQNLGAGDIKRTKKFLWCAVGTLAVFAVVYCLPFYIFARQLAGLYTTNEVTIQAAVDRSWIIFFDLLLCVVLSPLNALCSGSGHSNWSLWVYLSGDALIRIPLTIALGVTHQSIWILSLAYPVSTVLGLIIGFIFYGLKKWQNLKSLPVFQDQDESEKAA